MPADDSVAVPTNTELRVLYFGTLGSASSGAACALPLSRMRLVADAGEPVELEATMEPAGETEAWMVARPDAGLMPNTHYALEVLTSQAGDCACDGARAWTRVTAFTTGGGADAQAPSWTEPVRIRAGKRIEASNNCGSTDGWALDVDFEPAQDASPGVRYDIFVDGVLATRYVEDLPSELLVDCGSATLFTSTVLQPGARIELEAVDLAGNASPASSIVQDDLRCDEGPAAAGAGATDGGVAEPGSTDGGTSSCTAAAGARGSSLPGPLLVLSLVVLRRRCGRRW